MAEKTSRTLKTVETALEVVNLIQEMDGARLTELQEKMGIPKSTLYYHVNTLEEHGYLIKEGAEFNIGAKFLVHGQYTRSRKRDYKLAAETVRELARQTNEDVDFSIEEHGRLITIHHHVGNSAESGFQLGQTYNLTSTASGKAILSEYPKSRVEEIIDQWGFENHTKNSITDRTTFFAELDRTRERGYGLNDEELVEGLYSISSPVKYPDGRVIGSLSIMVPAFRFEFDDLVTEFSEPLLKAVAELEEEIE